MRLIRATEAAEAAALAAREIATACLRAVTDRGRALIAVSGGETPWHTLEHLREIALPWNHICVTQVDERVVPRGDPRRNLTRLERILVADGPLPGENLLAMPVDAGDLGHAAGLHQRRLEALAGKPITLDLVQLGLGVDGHTASLVPGDPLLAVEARDVAVSSEYQGLRRMTLTFPALNRARHRLWIVTGAAKAARLAELLRGDATSDAPALRVNRADVTVVADETAVPTGGPSPG